MHTFTEEDGETFVRARILVCHAAYRRDRTEELMVTLAIAA
jgi:hypothetical protein